jgi:cupin fold WbuC family metalloprotein
MPPDLEFAQEPVAALTPEALERIRLAARDSPRRRARLCLHGSLAERLHEMIIVLRRGTEILIHRHPHKAECYHVLDGFAVLRIVDANGVSIARQELGPFGSGRATVCRIAEGLWHTLEIESDELILHESTTGPWQQEDTEYFASNP